MPIVGLIILRERGQVVERIKEGGGETEDKLGRMFLLIATILLISGVSSGSPDRQVLLLIVVKLL